MKKVIKKKNLVSQTTKKTRHAFPKLKGEYLIVFLHNGLLQHFKM